MTNPNITKIQLLLDRSGSMAGIKTDMEGAISTYFEEQAKQPGECNVSLAQFDDRYEIVYLDTPIADVPRLELVPRNSTALYDAMARAINGLGDRLATLPEDQRPGKVLFVIITDGMENASKEVTGEQVRDMVKRQEQDYGWTFVYIGANQDSYAVGAGLGISANNSLNYAASQVGTASMSSNLSGYTTRFREAGTTGFTEDEQRTGDESR